ncbi:hypothetical protein ACO7_640029 [Thiomonas arsenitoxydans]|nr:hypothetical protein ACO3_620029 [Thiomonas arsenitoxydans]CQR40685.1 hypothetical protein ACO7_640029 [Thiomonas arsenitoxydans]
MGNAAPQGVERGALQFGGAIRVEQLAQGAGHAPERLAAFGGLTQQIAAGGRGAHQALTRRSVSRWARAARLESTKSCTCCLTSMTSPRSQLRAWVAKFRLDELAQRDRNGTRRAGKPLVQNR